MKKTNKLAPWMELYVENLLRSLKGNEEIMDKLNECGYAYLHHGFSLVRIINHAGIPIFYLLHDQHLITTFTCADYLDICHNSKED